MTFAEDAIYAALAMKSSGQSVSGLGGLSEQVVARGVSRLQVSYQSESLEGQTLTSHLWQNEEEGDQVVRCSIERDGRNICQLVIQYHS